jgi:hypothetical protein
MHTMMHKEPTAGDHAGEAQDGHYSQTNSQHDVSFLSLGHGFSQINTDQNYRKPYF